MRRYNGEAVQKMLTRLKLPDDLPIESKIVSREIATAQTQVEQINFETRKHVLKYDEVMNQQRKVIYAARQRILRGEDLGQQVRIMLVDVITGYVNTARADHDVTNWDVDALWAALSALYPVGVKDHRWKQRRGRTAAVMRKALLQALISDSERAFSRREAQLEESVGEGGMRQRERDVLLDVIDRKWREHLYAMDYLKEGIGLRALAQRDPLVEFQREGYDMFMATLDAVREESLSVLFNADVTPEARAAAPVASTLRVAEFRLGPAAADAAEDRREGSGLHAAANR